MKVTLANENFQNNYLYNLLSSRGVKDVEQYLNPTSDCLADYELLNNIYKGAALFLDKVQTESNILICVDCDVDGFTSAAILWNYIKLQNFPAKLFYKLHKGKQHGLEDFIKEILAEDTHYDLIILPDSSSNDFEYHEQLKELGSRCLVLDHHDVEENTQFSSNAIIINNQLSPDYPNKELTGAGVTWQFCRACDNCLNTNFTPELIDLAALGICGDMGSILELENRFIMIEGFKNINNYFFKCAIEKQAYSMGNEVTPISVAFYIVPLMNALIRMGTQDEKERLFLGLVDGHRQVTCNKRGAKGTTEEVAIESLRECTNAKSKQNRVTDQMVEEIEQKIFKYDLLENKILFVRLEEEDYPQEINGLCAMKLAAKYKHPTILARLNSEGYDKGSIRNVSDCGLTDLKAFLNDSGYFEWVQGHPNAAGACIKDSNLRDFHKYANEALKDINFNEGVYTANFQRSAEDIDLEDLILDLGKQSNVWGQNNDEPLIYIPNIMLGKDDFQVIGSKLDTLKIIINDITFIKFHATEMIEELRKCNVIKINLIGRPNINVWMGRRTPQILIEDYEVIDDLLEF